MPVSKIIEVFPEKLEAQLSLFIKAILTVAEEEVGREREEAE